MVETKSFAIACFITGTFNAAAAYCPLLSHHLTERDGNGRRTTENIYHPAYLQK